MIYALDIFGTFVFAVSGAFRAVKYELDMLGVLVLAISTGVGGGILRDLLLGDMPPAAFRDETYLFTCLGGGMLVFLAAKKIAARWDCVMAADALGLSVFAAIGAAKAASCGMGIIGIIMMAALTACGGGVIRDILVSEIPAVLKADFYATAALIGGACFIIAARMGFSEGVQLLCSAGATFLLRIIAMKYGISLPKAKSLSSSPSQLTRKRKAYHESRQKAEKPDHTDAENMK